MNKLKIDKNPVIQLNRSKYLEWFEKFCFAIPICCFDFYYEYDVLWYEDKMSYGYTMRTFGYNLVVERLFL